MGLKSSFIFPIPLQNYEPNGLAAEGLNTQAMPNIDAGKIAFARPPMDVSLYAEHPSAYEAAMA